ncbi:hypothetical protein GKC30_12445 [Pseudodesulfovibrio sp. F-1]|uniref:Uncharacterized protein n=1 Tax=Pseudodesulfovibrio alkaliphilus TaxID=2661613 RepID=A0A7K1KQR3_9BACT|nr:hypothetical protein [Pseudodesulfovibrio alkaliphilus]MUM78446.1 hypothetical protein [Pseudodesulfovibrio alkaliphilus]
MSEAQPFYMASGVNAMNLLKLNLWRKIILVVFASSVVAMFAIDWGYDFHIRHVVRLAVGAMAFWVVLDRP